MQIVIQHKHSYGNMRVYPVCENAHLFARIAGTRTLTEDTLSAIMELGVQIVEASQWYAPPVEAYESDLEILEEFNTNPQR